MIKPGVDVSHLCVGLNHIRRDGQYTPKNTRLELIGINKGRGGPYRDTGCREWFGGMGRPVVPAEATLPHSRWLEKGGRLEIGSLIEMP